MINSFVIFGFFHAGSIDSNVVAFGLVFNNFLKISNPNFHAKLVHFFVHYSFHCDNFSL